MAYDDYERRRFDRGRDFRRGDSQRQSFGTDYERSRWPDESSWGYGPEYVERPAERFPETFRTRPFEGEGQVRQRGSEPTGGATGFPPETESFRRGAVGRQPEAYELRPETSYYGTSRHLSRIPRGPFTGVGPRNYRRSDERIREDVNEGLAAAGELDATDIEVFVSNCEITLEGEVENREQKRLAEDLAEAAPGVRDVHNKLRVRKGFFARLFGTDEERERPAEPRESR